MTHALANLSPQQIADIQRQVFTLRQQIALAQNKRVGIDAAIESRRKSLARLEAQLALASPVQSARELIAARS